MTLTMTKDNSVAVEERVSEREFSFHDKCDRCKFQGYIVAQKKGFHELIFCGHHGRKHAPALVGTGWNVLDFTHMINEKPSPSASFTEADDEWDDDDIDY